MSAKNGAKDIKYSHLDGPSDGEHCGDGSVEIPEMYATQDRHDLGIDRVCKVSS